MYRIETINGEFIANVEKVHYVKRDKATESWIDANVISGEAVTVKGKIFNVVGFPIIAGYPVVKILEIIEKDKSLKMEEEQNDITISGLVPIAFTF